MTYAWTGGNILESRSQIACFDCPALAHGRMALPRGWIRACQWMRRRSHLPCQRVMLLIACFEVTVGGWMLYTTFDSSIMSAAGSGVEAELPTQEKLRGGWNIRSLRRPSFAGLLPGASQWAATLRHGLSCQETTLIGLLRSRTGQPNHLLCNSIGVNPGVGLDEVSYPFCIPPTTCHER